MPRRASATCVARQKLDLLDMGHVDHRPVLPLDPPANSRLADVHVPALIMAGALDYPTTLYAADIMAEGISGARKHIFAHSAHLPNMEEPDEFTQVVLEFLAGL